MESETRNENIAKQIVEVFAKNFPGEDDKLRNFQADVLAILNSSFTKNEKKENSSDSELEIITYDYFSAQYTDAVEKLEQDDEWDYFNFDSEEKIDINFLNDFLDKYMISSKKAPPDSESHWLSSYSTKIAEKIFSIKNMTCGKFCVNTKNYRQRALVATYPSNLSKALDDLEELRQMSELRSSETEYSAEKPDTDTFYRSKLFLITVYSTDPNIPIPLLMLRESCIVIEWIGAEVQIDRRECLLWIRCNGRAERWLDPSDDAKMARKIAKIGNLLREAIGFPNRDLSS